MLIVDDEESVCKVLANLFTSRGFQVKMASEGEAASHLLASENFDIMLTDICMSPIDGLTLLKQAHEKHPMMPVLMLTAYASVVTAIESLKYGAFDYITKPFDIGELLNTVDRAIEFSRGVGSKSEIKTDAPVHFLMEGIVGESEGVKDVCTMIKKIAPTETIVSIVGEAGTGKGLIAQALHNNSSRRDKQFMRINCATIPEPMLESELFGHEQGPASLAKMPKKGLFEQIHGGTLFLEEAGCLPPNIQTELLKVIQERKLKRIGGDQFIAISARLIVSSNTDMEALVRSGRFREDLFYRLNVISIRIKPFRERVEDIVPVFTLMIQKNIKEGTPFPQIDPSAKAILESYPWPGNAEEINNAAKFALANLKDNVITQNSLPPRIANCQVKPDSARENPYKTRHLKAYLKTRGADLLQKTRNGNANPPESKAGK